MDIDAVLAGIGTNVQPIPGLLYIPYLPDGIGDVPALFPSTVDVEFDQAMKRGQDRLDITLQLLVCSIDDLSRARALNGYLSGSGASSLKARISSDRQLGGACHDLRLQYIRGYRMYEHGGIKYLGAQVSMFVLGPGN